jgi:hypothetical protein
MELQKQARYSKPLQPDETEEVLMDEESDDELEGTYKLMEPHPQKMKITPSKPKLCFRLEELGICHISLISMDLQMASTDQLSQI